jgi:chromosome partitioning protein
MATISLASVKGGVSKTSLALLLASELALDGYPVALLDADLNQQAAAFGRKSDISNLTIIGDVREDNILALLRQAEADNEVVMVDLPGGSSTLALKSLHRSHFVIVPRFESRAARHVRQTVEAEQDITILKTALMERAAFRELHITGRVPRQTDPNGTAAANVTALAAELLQEIAKLREAA